MWLKRFDLFPKINAESRRTTDEGGFISLIGMILGFVLFLNETLKLTQTSTLEKLEFFQETHANLTVYLDVTFYHLKCNELAFDVSTSAENDLQKMASGWKTRKLDRTPLFENDEGCAVAAVVDITGYQSGEMHVALSPHLVENGRMAISIDEYLHYNSSHQITSISVGETSYGEFMYYYSRDQLTNLGETFRKGWILQ
jgi:hypothetical protein